MPQQQPIYMDTERTAHQLHAVQSLTGRATPPRPRKNVAVNLHPYANWACGRWQMLRQAPATRSELVAEALKLLFTGYLKTLTPSQTELDQARSQRDGKNVQTIR